MPDVASARPDWRWHLEHSMGGGALTERQRRLVIAAIELFAERGYAATTTADIAARAEVSEATLFKRWKTKQQLLDWITGPFAEDHLVPQLARGVQMPLSQRPAKLETMLGQLIVERFSAVHTFQPLLRLLLQELPIQPRLRTIIGKVMHDSLTSHLSPALIHFQSLGQIHPGLRPEAALRLILSVVGGYLLPKVLFGSTDDLPSSPDDPRIRELIGLVSHGLAGPPLES